MGFTPLMLSARDGHVKIVELLIAAKADIESRSLKHSTPLMLAASKGRTKCVDVLIRNGAHVNASTNVSSSIIWLHIITYFRSITNNISVTYISIIFVQLGFTALMSAAQEGHPEVVNQLIAAKAEIKARSQYGYTALYMAVSKGQSECVSVLLKNGAYPNSTDYVIACNYIVHIGCYTCAYRFCIAAILNILIFYAVEGIHYSYDVRSRWSCQYCGTVDCCKSPCQCTRCQQWNSSPFGCHWRSDRVCQCSPK